MSFLVWFFFEQQFKPHVADKLHIISEILLSRPFLKNVKPLEAGSLHISIFTQFPDLRKLADSLDVDPLVNSHRGSHLWLTFYPEVGNNSILWNHRYIMEFFFEFEICIKHLLGSDGDSLLFEQLLEGQDWGNNWKVNLKLRRLNNCHRNSHKQRTQNASNTNQGRRLQHHTRYQPSRRHKPGDKIGKCCIEKNLVFSWEPWLLRDRPGHFWTLALPLRLGYNWTLKTKDLRDLCDAPLNFLFWWVPELNQ